MTVYLVEKDVKYEGTQLLAIYTSREQAEAHAQQLRKEVAGEFYPPTFHVTECRVREFFTPGA